MKIIIFNLIVNTNFNKKLFYFKNARKVKLHQKFYFMSPEPFITNCVTFYKGRKKNLLECR